MSNQSTITQTQVLIVGAGPAGLGVALALKQAGVTDQLVVDAREVGAAFKSWPKGMSLLTPSFFSNSFGLTDLNSIDPNTSPADFLNTQHPDGPAYATYLEALVGHFKLPVRTGVMVEEVEKTDDGFVAATSKGPIQANYVVWAVGQFFHPCRDDFPGAEHALHSSQVKDWDLLEGDQFVIIGGYESGVDAALNLVHRGKKVRLISSGEPWASDHPDPSRSLSPRTLDRLRDLLKTSGKVSLLEFTKNTRIEEIEAGEGYWTLKDKDDFPIATRTRPILANGFQSGLGLVDELFDYDENDLPVFSEEADESTITPGLFYSGPSLIHRNALFCFIYKFRARFGVIAREIAQRMEIPNVEENLRSYAEAGFMNTDLDCCTNCQCAVESKAQSTPEPASFEQN